MKQLVMLFLVGVALCYAENVSSSARDSWLKPNVPFTNEAKHINRNMYGISHMRTGDPGFHRGKHNLRLSDHVTGGKRWKHTR
jgi:hypothetical protein